MKEIDLGLLRLVNNVSEGMTDEQDYIYLLELLQTLMDITEDDIERAILKHYEETINAIINE